MRLRWARRTREPAADDTVAAAGREVELSRQRLRDTREQVVAPLQGYAERNNFAGMIAASLTQPQRKGGPRWTRNTP